MSCMRTTRKRVTVMSDDTIRVLEHDMVSSCCKDSRAADLNEVFLW